MIITNNKSNQAKKCCTDSLSEEEIEKEISTTVNYSNAYVLKNIQPNLVTNGLAHVVEERPEGISLGGLRFDAKKVALEWGLQSAANAILNVCYHSEEYRGIRSE